MADNLQATPRNELLGLLSDAMYGGINYMKDPRRSQQMQGLAGLLESTGIPQTTQRMAYGEPLTNIGRANVPLLKPETADAMMNVAPFAPVVGRLASRAIRATEGMPVGMGIKPINLNKGIYKPELTMEEMLTVKDIPTVDRVRKSIDLVGEKEFEKMVNAQYKKYKPSDQDQEAMLVESVTLDILGRAQRSPYPQQAALDLAQQRAALPVEQGGLGLPATNTAADRAKAMGFDTPAYRGITGDIDQSIVPSDFFGSNYFGKGINLTTSPKDASKYASTDVGVNTDLVGKAELMSERLGISYPQAKADLTSGGGAVLPMLANIKNPLIVGMQKIQAPDSMIRYALNESGYSGDVDKLVDQFKNANTGIEQFELIKANQATPFYRSMSSLMNKDGLMIDESISPKSEGAMHYLAVNPDQLRSRFAAFDPFRKDVATATAMGVALPDLLAAEPTPEELQRRQPASLLFP
jgi:hypothetical protein